MVFKLMATATGLVSNWRQPQLQSGCVTNTLRTVGEHLENTWRTLGECLGDTWGTVGERMTNTL